MIIDYFPYFNEKELLELRINLLKDHVDLFVISEGNRTFSGNPKEFSCKEVVRELGLPEEKILILEMELPSNDDKIMNEEIDHRLLSLNEKVDDDKTINAWTRERMQKNAIQYVLDRFNDDDVFFISDCDEIPRPEVVEYFAKVVANNKDKILRVPLVWLEGRADLRVHNKNTGLPKNLNDKAYMCTKKLLSTGAIQIRANINCPYESIYVTQDGKMIEDCGWHFSWMGDADRMKIKLRSFSHYNAKVSSSVVKDFREKEIETFIENWKGEENGINPWGNNEVILKKYPLSSLPNKIFELPRVNKFLLG